MERIGRKYGWISILVLIFIISLYSIHQSTPLDFLVTRYLRNINYPRISFALSIALLSFAIEIIGVGWSNSSLKKLLNPNKSAKTDIFIGLLYYLNFGSVLYFIFSLGTTKIIPTAVKQFFGEGIISDLGNYTVQVIIYLLIVDFLHYLSHWVTHKIQFLWEIHKYHHSATDFLIITGNRVHPLEKVFQLYFNLIPLAILGASPEMLFIILIIKNLVDSLQHSMVNWNYGWVGRWIVYSPMGHRIHHSLEEEHWDKNFGDIFVIWDRIFGTYYTGSNMNKTVGVTDNIYNKNSVIGDLWLSTKMAGIKFYTSLKSGRWLSEHLYDDYKEQSHSTKEVE